MDLLLCQGNESYFSVFPGGHAPMWSLPDDECTNKLIAQVYENNGVVCAVCHGTAGNC